MREIATCVADAVPGLVKGKDIEANVRARMVIYTRKNFNIQKDGVNRAEIITPALFS